MEVIRNFGFRIVDFEFGRKKSEFSNPQSEILQDFDFFCLAVLPAEVKIAVSSPASLSKSDSLSFSRSLESRISSSQKSDSSHSSSTIVILEMKSALLLALQTVL